MKDRYFVFAAIGIFIVLAIIIFWPQTVSNASVDSFSASYDAQQEIVPLVPESTPSGTLDAPDSNATDINDTKMTKTALVKTDKGTIKIELFADKTPKTVENFVTLATKRFYDGTVFHRTINGFMIQGGDPKGDGTGGPGYKFDDEPFDGDYTRGTVAMANSGPNTNGSQFFIMHQDTALPKNYVIFGKVVEGLEVVDAIATAPVASNAFGEASKPVTPVKVVSVEIQ